MCLADKRSPQLYVMRAIFDHRLAAASISLGEYVSSDLLKQSALILNYNTNCTSLTKKLLKSVNRPVLVRVLTHEGPQYLTKELTSKCFRHSRELYYTARFSDLFFSLLLTNEARNQKSVDKLYFMFGNSSTAIGLFLSDREI